MREHTLYVTIKVKVKSNLEDFTDVIDEFESNCDYEFKSTDNVEVSETEWLETTL